MSGEQARDQQGDNGSSQGKDRKGGLSCAECRRSKLKCDRNVPCQACVRRGCAAICPDGTLMATKGNRVLQARAEKLGEEVKTMSARIADLERELAQTQQNLRLATSTSVGAGRIFETARWEPDARQDDQLIHAVGSLAINIHEEGGTKYYGSTSSSEYLSTLLPGDGTEIVIEKLRDPRYLGLPDEVLQLVYAFPLGMRDCPYNKRVFLPFFPSYEKAVELADLYYQNDAWQFRPVLRKEFNEDIFDTIYGSGHPMIEGVHPHKLAVFFSILAMGTFFSRENALSLTQEQYHALACALISLEPISRNTTYSTVQAFFLIVRFLNMTVRSAAEDCWILFGMCVRVAQTMGLHYDGTIWNLCSDEVQHRRALFWEIYTWNCWNAFFMGRPPSIHLEDTNCRYPANDFEGMSASAELGFHAWKYRYTAACLPWTLKHASSAGAAAYDVLMELDRKIRTFPVPPKLHVSLQEGGLPWSSDATVAMQQCNCIFMKEANLLYLHRSFFSIALREDPTNPMEHKFGLSVVATFRSARRMCIALRGLYLIHAEPLGHFWYFWSCIFSSCILLSALIHESPGCPLAQEALMELNNAAAFFEEGSSLCRPPKSMIVLAKLKQRARDSFTNFHAPDSRGRANANSNWMANSDSLDIVEGQHGVVAHAHSEGTLSHVSSRSRGSHSPNSVNAFAVSFERARDSPMSIPPIQDMNDMGGQAPTHYDAIGMQGIMLSSPQGPFVPSYASGSAMTLDQSLNHLEPMDFYGYNLTSGNASSASRGVPMQTDMQDASFGLPHGRHSWKAFIEGLMDPAMEPPS